MKLVIVEWDDSCSNTGWHTIDLKNETISKCISVGIALIENDEQVTILQSISNTTGNIGDTITIPKDCIKRIRKLKVS